MLCTATLLFKDRSERMFGSTRDLLFIFLLFVAFKVRAGPGGGGGSGAGAQPHGMPTL